MDHLFLDHALPIDQMHLLPLALKKLNKENFGSEDLSGELTHNGLARGVWILLRHFTNGSDVYKSQSIYEGLTGGFLRNCVLKTKIR